MITGDDDDYPIIASGETEDKAWAAAYAFTKQREQEIADVEEEIEVQERKTCQEPDCGDPEHMTINRTITRLQGILAELKRGWKGGK